MNQTVLKTENLKKQIGKRVIVSDISLELVAGEIFGFLGPNGAGKTTTIKMIVGLSRITEGNIWINGCSVREDFTQAMRHVGCIVENPEMYKYMSGLDNLRVFARMYGGIGEERIREIVKTVDLEAAIKDKVKTYSLGMRQRLGIAQALLHKPRLLILDEPTNGLDPAGIREMRELLRRLAVEEKLTVFVSSHILAEMQQMCDRVGIIHKGKLLMTRQVDELTGLTNRDGALTLLFTTDNPEKTAALLKQAGAKVLPSSEGVEIQTLREAIPQLVALLVQNGISIYGMDKKEATSLEDVFMKLTGEVQ